MKINLWIGFLNDLFCGPSYIARLAEMSIPVVLDEKRTVEIDRLDEPGIATGCGSAGLMAEDFVNHWRIFNMSFMAPPQLSVESFLSPKDFQPPLKPDNQGFRDDAAFAVFVANNIPALIGSAIDVFNYAPTILARLHAVMDGIATDRQCLRSYTAATPLTDARL